MTGFRTATDDDPISDSIWNALQSTHARLGLHRRLACKYRADVSPFAALKENSIAAMEDLRELLQPGEYTYVMGERPPQIKGLKTRGPMGVLQMLFPEGEELPEENAGPALQRLDCKDAAAMVALTDLAFPGFFRPRTCEMGDYCGVWDGDRLIAMGGERLVFEPYREISGICTLPEFRGLGLAARVICRILRDHRNAGIVSWLHVAAVNSNAIALYERLGFTKLREVQLHQVMKQTVDEAAGR